jgi:hypothetical protein
VTVDPTELVFHDDLPAIRRPGIRQPSSPLPDTTLRALRRHPGQWAKVADGKWSSTAHNWTKRLHALGHTDIELVTRNSRISDTGYRVSEIWATSNIDVAAP